MPTFLETANDLIKIQRVAPQTRKHTAWLLERLKPLHSVDVAAVDAPKLLAALRAIEADGAESTAHRACAFAGAVIRYALAAGTRTAPDPSAGLKTILVAHTKVHRAAITEPARFGALLRAIDTLEPSAVRDALRLAPHVFVRPCELRGMRWSELKADWTEWHIPRERMKMRRPFVKYLSPQSVGVLREIAGRYPALGEFVFPGRVSGSISENIMGLALVRLFYLPEEMTPHGFRASASTMLHEAGEKHEVIEAALAHRTKDPLGSAYNRAVYVEAQVELHARWSGMVEAMRGAS